VLYNISWSPYVQILLLFYEFICYACLVHWWSALVPEPRFCGERSPGAQEATVGIYGEGPTQWRGSIHVVAEGASSRENGEVKHSLGRLLDYVLSNFFQNFGCFATAHLIHWGKIQPEIELGVSKKKFIILSNSCF
jgi:hypothetical protein